MTGQSRDQERLLAAFSGAHILVCGASGNLGGHLARQLAPLGVRLSLWGRREDALGKLDEDCQSGITTVQWRAIDIADVDAALAALRETDDATPVDCAFFVSGAGDTRETGRLFDSPELIARLGVVNYVAPAALAAELGDRMARRGAGRIAMVGTAAASHPLPFAAGYVSSKGGLALFTESLRATLKPHGVSVTLASPGFFAPASSAEHAYARPGEIAPDLVAAQLIRATAKGRSEIVTPRWFLGLRWLGRLLPRPLYDRLLLSLPVP